MMVQAHIGGRRRPRTLLRSRNTLLASLPLDEYQRILPLLNTVPLTFKQVVHKRGSKIDTIYFPQCGICSIVNTMADGRSVEVASMGNEGFVGVTVFLGGDVALEDVFVQIGEGTAHAMSAQVFRRELDSRGPFYDVIRRYSQAWHALIMQSTGCHSLHSVEQRCSRWLLMTQDRVASDELHVTHEFLGLVLGVRRPTVSSVLGVLDKAGVIRNGVKTITVVDRRKLQKTSCECYQIVQNALHSALTESALSSQGN